MTIKNISEIQTFNSDKFTKDIIFKESTSQAFILNFMPGQKLPSHGHPYTHVYLLVIEGNGTCQIDEEKYDIKQNDAIHCEKEQLLSIENTSDNKLSLYVVLARESHVHSERK